MMKKTIATIAISGIMVSSLMAVDLISPVFDFNKYPIPQDLTSVSRGGTLPDKLSATDGMGTLMLPKVGKDNSKIDNSTFNKLLKTNKNKLTDTINLTDLINSGEIQLDATTIKKLNILTNINFNNGPQKKIYLATNNLLPVLSTSRAVRNYSFNFNNYIVENNTPVAITICYGGWNGDSDRLTLTLKHDDKTILSYNKSFYSEVTCETINDTINQNDIFTLNSTCTRVAGTHCDGMIYNLNFNFNGIPK